MKKLLLLPLLLVLSACATATAEGDPEQEVTAAETARFQAMVDKDFATLERLIGDDLHYIHSDGSTDTKEQFIGAIREGVRWYDDITIEELKVRVYGGETAVLNGRATFHRQGPDGEPANLSLYYTDVYVKRGGEWQMVSWQSLRL
jgi:ketosteroid isomerase-like protein